MAMKLMTVEEAQIEQIRRLHERMAAAQALIEKLLDEFDVWELGDGKIVDAARKICDWSECHFCGEFWPETRGRVVQVERGSWDCPPDTQWVCDYCLGESDD